MKKIYSCSILFLLILNGVCFNSASAQSITRGPYLQSPGTNSIIIRWRTDSLTDSRVYYGSTIGSTTFVADSITPTTEHRVRINGLSPKTKYYYSIGSSTQVLRGSDPLMHFTTAPDPSVPTPVRLWAIGDFGHGNIDQRDVRDAYLSFTANQPADLQIWLGDNVYQDGTDLEYSTKVFDTVWGYGNVFPNLPFMPTPGNHDYNSVCAWAAPCNTDPNQHTGPYIELVDPPSEGEMGGVPSHLKHFYSFDYGDIHFISLNSELGSFTPAYNWVGLFNSSTSFTSPMIDWLKADLAATTKKWKIAFWHQCPYSGQDDFTEQSSFQYFTYASRAHFNPHLEQYGVDLVLTGHDHNYQRSYLVNGLYDFKAAFTPFMIVDGSSGDADIGEAYVKYTNGPQAGKGTVYVVEGNSSGSNAPSSFDHPYILRGEACDSCIGSLIVDINGDRLDGYYLTAYDSIRDHFTILKQAWNSVTEAENISRFTVTPNPFDEVVEVAFSLMKRTDVKISLLDISGRIIYEKDLGEKDTGNYTELLNTSRETVAEGIYLLRLTCGSETKYIKLVKSDIR